MSTFIIAFIIFALTGLGIRYYIKGKGYMGLYKRRTRNEHGLLFQQAGRIYFYQTANAG